MTSPAKFRILAIAAVAIVATSASVVLAMRGDGGVGADDDARTTAATSSVFRVGHEWKVRVRKDAGLVSAAGHTSVHTSTYEFRVTEAPSSTIGEWRVDVALEGAEGTFASGWTLWYTARGDALILTRLAQGDREPVAASLAAAVVGSDFPLTTTYDAPPEDAVVSAKDAGAYAARALPPTTTKTAPPGTRTVTRGGTVPAGAADASGAPNSSDPARAAGAETPTVTPPRTTPTLPIGVRPPDED